MEYRAVLYQRSQLLSGTSFSLEVSPSKSRDPEGAHPLYAGATLRCMVPSAVTMTKEDHIELCHAILNEQVDLPFRVRPPRWVVHIYAGDRLRQVVEETSPSLCFFDVFLVSFYPHTRLPPVKGSERCIAHNSLPRGTRFYIYKKVVFFFEEGRAEQGDWT